MSAVESCGYNLGMSIRIPSTSTGLNSQGAASLPAEALALLQNAVRRETPCGEGVMVWHVWSAQAARSAHPPLVLLHGGSGSWTHWVRNIAAMLASGREVYVPDLPGFGDSAVPAHGSDADALPEPVEQGLRLLLGCRSCDLVGFSFGAMVGGFIARLFPARAARLVLVGAPGLGLAPLHPINLRGWRHLSEPAEREAVHQGNLAALMLYHKESIDELALGVHIANMSRDRMKGRRLSRTDALAQSLQAVQCPVDAIYGSEDALYLGNMEQLAQTLRRIPNFKSFRTIEDAGHWVQFERADAFNETLITLLNRPG
jgi:2-hydroxy-6-oxonona-2,4-dienedioate hydrolase